MRIVCCPRQLNLSFGFFLVQGEVFLCFCKRVGFAKVWVLGESVLKTVPRSNGKLKMISFFHTRYKHLNGLATEGSGQLSTVPRKMEKA